MTPADLALLNSFEKLADFGAWLVIIGVIGEGVEIGIKICEHKVKNISFLKWCGKHEFAIEIYGAFFWIMVVVGLLMELRYSGKAQVIVKNENTRITREAGEARIEAGRAELDASRANELASSNLLAAKQLEIKLNETKTALANAEARLNESVYNLQQENLPFDIGDQSTFANALMPLKGIKVIFVTIDDTRSLRTAKYLEFAFALAQWETIRKQKIDDFLTDGITLGFNGDVQSSNAVFALRELLISRGVPPASLSPVFNTHFVGDVPTNTIIVIVGKKQSESIIKYRLLEEQRNDLLYELAEHPSAKKALEINLRFNSLEAEIDKLRALASPTSTNMTPGLHLKNNVFVK